MSVPQTNTNTGQAAYVVLRQEPETFEDNHVEIDTGNQDIISATDKSHAIVNVQKSHVLLSKQNKSPTDQTRRLLSALMYGICSFLITVINKIVLTSYQFPSPNVLATGQMVAIIIMIKVARICNLIELRRMPSQSGKVYLLSFFYLGNLISGLGGTKHLPLPMFIALRRFSIAMTAIGEYYVLKFKPKFSIICTIIAMIAGSFIAAAGDLTYTSLGYSLVMINNFFTASQGVYTRCAIDSHKINKNEILFYSALFSLLPMIMITYLSTDIQLLDNFSHWKDIGFLLSFFGSCFMGYLLMFSTVLCTQYNSALTTTIVGTLKNILATYVGMFIGGDYRYSALNFLGLNISLIGSLVYTYLTFRAKSP